MHRTENIKEFAVIGYPLDQSMSPVLHAEVFNQLNINATYRKIEISKQKFLSQLSQKYIKKLTGFNVTTPHKKLIMDKLDFLDPIAEKIGAVNCVLIKEGELKGFNTDYFGFDMSLKKNNIEVDGKSVLLLGAGGVSFSVVYALIKNKTSKIVIKNRTENKINLLIDRFGSVNKHLEMSKYDESYHSLNSFDIIINCTSVGMYPSIEYSPISSNQILPKHTIIETIYNPIKTQLLKGSKLNGAKIFDGLDMFIYQGLASLDIWLNENISETIKYQNLKKKIINQLC